MASFGASVRRLDGRESMSDERRVVGCVTKILEDNCSVENELPTPYNLLPR